MDKTPATECIHCHLCRESCSFLSKYGIDIGDTDKLKELAYHCFLCGKCTEVCPEGIDGRQTVIDMRREIASSDEKAVEKKYKGLLGEKRNYKFRNWKRVTSGSVFFPGCNFPSMYPKTTAYLSKLFGEAGIGTVYECCGKPVAELGLAGDEERILEEIRTRLKENDVTEIVTACPNCREFFGDKLGIRIVSVYTKLTEMGIGNKVHGDAAFYIPCPDRADRIWIEEIRPYIEGNISFVDGVQCCGLGGSAAAEEPEIAASFTGDIRNSCSGIEQRLFTYCASCMGQFGRNGFRSIEHILPVILGIDEGPDTGKSYINRVITRFK